MRCSLKIFVSIQVSKFKNGLSQKKLSALMRAAVSPTSLGTVSRGLRQFLPQKTRRTARRVQAVAIRERNQPLDFNYFAANSALGTEKLLGQLPLVAERPDASGAHGSKRAELADKRTRID